MSRSTAPWVDAMAETAAAAKRLSRSEEVRRVEFLHSLCILDTAPESCFDGLTAAAARATGCPTALVTLLDETRQWFKSRLGLLASETPIEFSFCAHTVQQDDVFEVEDALRDHRFARNPLVIGPPNIRFYAGVPLVVSGIGLGALCVTDTRPGRLSPQARSALVELASAASALLDGRRAHQELQTNQRRLGDIALASGDWLWETDADCRIRWRASRETKEGGSPLFQEHTLLPDGPMLDGLGAPLQPVVSLHAHLLQQSSVARAVVAGRLPDRTVYLSISALALRDPHGRLTGFRGTARDVTELIAQQRLDYESDLALRLDRDGARRSAALRSELVSRVSHELRTPLNAVLGFSQLLIRGATEPVFSATQIHRAATHLLRLVDDMLDLAVLESGRGTIEMRAISTAGVIRRCVELLQAEGQTRDVGIRWAIAPAAVAVRADVRGLTQVLLNLLSNALKFSPPGSGVQVDAGQAADGRVAISVVDAGPGIAPELLPTLFQPFSRIAAGTQRTGTGLGLAISRQLTQSMGGELTVRSTLAVGSTFTATFDGAAADDVAAHETDFSLLPAAPTPPPLTAQALKVLYVEDDPVNALVLDQMVTHLGAVDIHHADSASHGRALASTLEFDLILLDMNLPDGHGLDVLPTLRAACGARTVPIIAISADALPEAIATAFSAGFDDYLTKPVDLEVLERLLKGYGHRRDPHA